MATLTEGRYSGEFMISEGNGTISREAVTLDTGDLQPGTVLGKITKGAATAALVAGGTGNGTFSAVTLGAGSKVGVYSLIATAATKFNIEDPDGVLLGVVTLGTEFVGGGLTFTFTAGVTPHVAGDRATITVAAGTSKYVAYNQDGVNGSEIAAGILYNAADATSDDQLVTIIARSAEVNGDELVWPADIEAGEKTVAIGQLATLGIIVR